MDELRLVIEVPTDYATWRPATSLDAAAGAALDVTAHVETAKGGVPKTKVQQFVWELVQTSKEPGVAMDWPLDAQDTRFDLELDATGGHFLLSNEKQKLERAVQQGFSDTVKVVPYDWGGWSTLQVTAIMADGRRVRGKQKGKSETGLRVPKRDPQSHIADGWKAKHKSGADDLDDEKIAGQSDNGDGFSLYEEYRGFVVEGKYLEGDPEKKDFFVLNLIGADAQAGLDLFANVSQLTVHDRLLPAEMSQEKRLMNGNHRQGARKQEQHGVWFKTYGNRTELGGSGAFTVLDKPGVAGRPGLVKGIGLLARTDTDSDFNKPFNLAAPDRVGAFDRAVARELLHSVGVEHHGSGDQSMTLNFNAPNSRNSRLGRPYYSFGMRGQDPVGLLSETGDDVAVKDLELYTRMVEFYRNILGPQLLAEARELVVAGRNNQAYMDTPEKMVESRLSDLAAAAMPMSGIVGVEHGEHSGAEDCLMHYYFAKFYESKKPATLGGKQYYVIGEGTEHIGIQICHEKTGTGVNAPGHQPQSRYGDAGSGDCFHQICPNDGVPPHATK